MPLFSAHSRLHCSTPRATRVSALSIFSWYLRERSRSLATPHSLMRPALLVAAWTVCVSLRTAAGLGWPNELFWPAAPPGKQVALLPDGVVLGVVEAAQQGVQSPEACAEQCRAALPACDFFAYCKQSVSGMIRRLRWVGRRPSALPPSRCRRRRALPPSPPRPMRVGCRAAAAPGHMARCSRASA